MTAPAVLKPTALTPRDIAVLHHLAEQRAVPLEVLAARFFAKDPVNGTTNTNPLRACERRLGTLASAGHVWLDAFFDGRRGRRVAMLGPESTRFGASPGRNRVPPRRRAHHVCTLDALAVIGHDVVRQGGRVVRARLEVELLKEQQAGRKGTKGDTYERCPDAACTVETKDGRRMEVAVEYVTSKYTDKDIKRKHEGFSANYDRVLWFADGPRTALRVQALTGKPCATLS